MKRNGRAKSRKSNNFRSSYLRIKVLMRGFTMRLLMEVTSVEVNFVGNALVSTVVVVQMSVCTLMLSRVRKCLHLKL